MVYLLYSNILFNRFIYFLNFLIDFLTIITYIFNDNKI